MSIRTLLGQHAPAAAEDLAAFGLRLLEGRLHRFVGALVDERSHEHPVIGRRADAQRLVGGDDLVDELIGDGLVHDQPAQGRAALAGGAGRGEDHPAQGQVDVRARRHDGTVVAAELEQDPAEALGHDGADLTSHPHRAGRRDQGHSIISDHDVADVPTADEDGCEVLRRPHLGGGPRQQRLRSEGGEHGVLRGLPHHRVTGDQCQRRVPRVHGHGEVERGDDPDDAERMPGLHQPVPGTFAGHGLAPQLA